MRQPKPGAVLYHPYISEAGERGPFVNANARAGFIGLSSGHRFPDLLRAVVEGLGLADARLLRRDGRAAVRAAADRRRRALARRCARCSRAPCSAPVRVSSREEAGAAGAAMMAAVAIGAYPTMDDCIARMGDAAARRGRGARPRARPAYDRAVPGLRRRPASALAPVWDALAGARQRSPPTDDRIARGDAWHPKEHGMTEPA